MRSNHRSDILFFFAMLIALAAAYEVRRVLMIVYVSALFAVVIAPAIDLIRRLRIGSWRPGRGIAVILLVLGGLAVIAAFFAFAAPPIFHDMQQLAENWHAKLKAMTDRIHAWPFMANFDTERIQEYAAAALGGALNVVQNIAGGVFGVFSFLIITAYFILDGERAFDWALSMFAPERRQRLERTMVRAEKRMRHWLIGQSLLMLILGTSSTIVFGLLGIKYFYAIGVLTGLLNIVPIVGPVIALAVASVIALVDSPLKMLGVIAFFGVYQQLETAFLTPRIMKSTVDLPPLAVIISLSLGGALAGVLGALVAVPTAALCAVLIDEYLVDKSA